MAYLRYRLEIVAVVISLGAFAMFMPLGALLAARIRSVSFGRAQVMRIWVNVLLALGSLAGVWLLSNPTFGISRPVLAAILEAGRTESFSWMTQQFGWQWPLFVGYQILGLAASVVAMTMIALHSVKLYATTSTAVRLGANGSYRPGAVRSWLMSFLGSPGSVFTRAVVFTIMSLVLISGAGYALVTHLQPETVVPGTSAPAAPTSTSAESPGPTPAPPVTGTPTP
jgi:hypothetical protein